jgi:hypothetical protein
MTSDLAPFIDTLQEIASEAALVLLDAADPATTRSGVARYNAVGLYLITRVPDVAAVYRPLPAEATPGALRLAARDVALFVCDLPEGPAPEALGPGHEAPPVCYRPGPFAPVPAAPRTRPCYCA